jgi:hypothetical protein
LIARVNPDAAGSDGRRGFAGRLQSRALTVAEGIENDARPATRLRRLFG